MTDFHGAALAFVVEIVGALALIAGFGTWIAALALAALTLVASIM
jgi:putative oxidoreductase